MSTAVPVSADELLSLPAANEEFKKIALDVPPVVRTSGWDPYEVWRTRIRAADPRPNNPRQR